MPHRKSHQIALTVTIRVEGGRYVNIDIASTTGWLYDAGKDDRGRRRVERGFRTCTRSTKSLQNLIWGTIEPQSTHTMAPGPGRLAEHFPRPSRCMWRIGTATKWSFDIMANIPE